MLTSKRLGLLFLLLAALFYAFLPIVTKFAFEAGLQPIDFLTWRFLLAAPLMWLLLLVIRARTPKSDAPPLPRAKLIGAGMLFGLAAFAAFTTLQRIPASTYTILLYTYPAIVALILLALGDPLSRRGWVALALTLVGVALTVPEIGSIFDGGDLLGIGLALLNAFLYGVYIVWSSRFLRGHRDLTTAAAWSITGSMALLVLVTIARGTLGMPTPQGWLVILTMIGLCTILPISLFYAGMSRIGAGQAAILSTIEPVLVLVLSFIILNERLELIQLVGAALILASAVLLQLPVRRSTAAQAAGSTHHT
jgi:drug/metabolite transporter (DMT)-like permease